MKKFLHSLLFSLPFFGLMAQSDEPCTATALTVEYPICQNGYIVHINPTSGGGVYSNSTSASAGVTLPALVCNGFTTTTRDFWFTATIPATGKLEISTDLNGTVNDQNAIPSDFWDMAIYTASSTTCASSTFTEIASSCANENAPSIALTTVPAGTKVYIRLWREAPKAQTDNRFCRICAVESPRQIPSSCPTYNEPSSGFQYINDIPYLSWQAVDHATAYDIYLSASNPPSLLGEIAGTQTSAYIEGTAPNTSYFWYIVPKNSLGSASGCNTARIFTTAPMPPNDDCANAEWLLPIGTQTGTLAYATRSRPENPNCGSDIIYDVWYKFKTTASGTNATITVSTATGFDAIIEAFSGTCTGLTSVACADNGDQLSTNNPEVLTLTGLSPNTTYYLRVYSWDDVTITNGLPEYLLVAPFGISITGAVIPVELLSFEGSSVGQINQFKWQTATELNTQSFDIERSATGFEGFEKIGSVKAKGTTQERQNYTFTDLKPLPNAYYRLNIVDKDGTSQLSKTIHIEKHKAAKVKLYATVASDVLRFDIEGLQDATMQVQIFDVLGRLMMSQKIDNTVQGTPFSGERGAFTKNQILPIASLAQGTYVMTIRSSQGQVSEHIKFVKN
jgi:hypothetical protein